MGVFRLIFAIVVVFAHVNYAKVFVGASPAVEAFFMISGFYMSLVLTKTTAYRSTWTFYTNRYLRLYPLYCIVVVLSISANLLINPAAFYEFLSLPLMARIYLTFTNATMFFQDWVSFLGLNHGHLQFFKDFKDSRPYSLYSFLAISQGWTLGCELSFYVLAPFLLRLRTRWLLLVIFFSTLLRFVGFAAGFREDPWTYRFFPFELALFCSGSFAHRVYEQVKGTAWFQHRYVRGAALLSLAAFTFLYQVGNYPVNHPIRRPLYLALFGVCLPFLFDSSRKSQLDRAIGDLSYPVYIGHQLLLSIWLAIPFCSSRIPRGWTLGCIICTLSIGAAFILNRYVQEPVDLFRQRRKEHAAADLEGPPADPSAVAN